MRICWRTGVFVERKRISEAGNRTPVVRVTGGNTKPLYYFGSVNVPIAVYIKRTLGNGNDNEM